MANTNSQSLNQTLTVHNPEHANNGTLKSSASLLTPKEVSNNVKPSLRATLSSATLFRNRSPFRRSSGNVGVFNSQLATPSSFPLFRHFYLMRNAFTRRRTRELPAKINEPNDLPSAKKMYSSSRIAASHVLSTIFVTITSAGLLMFMIFLDFAYLEDAILNPINQPIISVGSKNSTTLCFRHPKVCIMKAIVVIVFIGITITLCYTILTLYIRAKRHSRLLERKTDELEKEKCLTEKLLHEILPPCVAKDLINGRQVPAEYYESVTVYFSDIVGFTIIASMCSPNETCDMLNRLYSIFDSLLENFDVYKVETIGDAYMVVSGAPRRNGDRHPNEIANMSLALLRCKQQVRVPRTYAQIQLRIGIHTGPVCAAVVGFKMPRYCMFGDTVNVASRMESSGLPERIHLSSDTYVRLINRDQYVFEERGEIAVKGKGYMRTYFLLDKKPTSHVSRSRSNTLSRSEREVS